MKFLERYVEPSKHCIEPRATIWKCLVDADHVKYFIQLGSDEEMNWIPLGELLEKLLVEELKD